MDGIRKAIGDDFVLEWHLSGSELTPGGLEIEDTIEIAKLLQDKVDMIHITCDSRSNAVTKAAMHPSHFIEHGHNASRAEAIKKAVIEIPVGVRGAITDPAKAEEIIANGQADYVIMARAVIADHDWANKARSGHLEDIRPCTKLVDRLSGSQ